MKRIIFLSLFLLLSLCAQAADFFAYFNTDDFWQMLVLDSVSIRPKIVTSDTAIVVASNRRYAPGKLRFLTDERDGDSTRYFVVYTRGSKWHISPQPSLRAAIAVLPAPTADWVIYAEGMGKIFTNDIDRGLKFSKQYGINVLLLDYPSIHTGYSPLRNYHFAYRNSCIGYQDFVPVLDSFQKLRQQGVIGNGKLTLFFHSMGNNLIREMMQHNQLAAFNHAVWADNLVLNAPCTPRKHSKRWIERLHFAKQVYVHYNPHDGVLKWARLASFRQLLGEHVKAPVADSVTFINFNMLCGSGHNNFLNIYGWASTKPEAAVHYNSLLHGNSIDLTNSERYQRTEDGIGWYITQYRQSSPAVEMDLR